MKKHSLIRYSFLFLGIFIALLLGVFLFFQNYSDRVDRELAEEKLEDGAANIQQQITSMLALTQQDFQHLVDNEENLLFTTLDAVCASAEDMQIFISDDDGRILISSTGAPRGAIPQNEVRKATLNARQGECYLSDLSGFLSHNRLCRTVVLEKEYSKNHRQMVGLIFITTPESGTDGMGKNLQDAMLFLFLLILAFTLMTAGFIYLYLLRPLAKLDKAAESFAKGDFSPRLNEKNSGSIAPLYRAYNQMAEKVENNEKNRQTFVSNVSHDLRTPLTTISGFVQNMLQGTIPQEKLGHYYKIILDEVNRLSRLVQTLLETSRMTAGERKYNFAPMDLCELGRVTLLSFEKRLEEKNIDVVFFCQEDSLFVTADQDAIQQVIYNLIDNAIKFTPEKGRLSLEITREEKKVFFAVTNSGEGIPEEELSHLFDRFYKSDRSRGLDKKGMGLGLFIAKSVINAHGEEIWVESKRGSYTQFVFCLPEYRGAKRHNL